jgi:hypothetical protein
VTYNRRDLIGHWVRKQQPTQRMCSHACCRNKRVHPKNYPVIMPDGLLRRASDEDLADAYASGSERRQAQILHEMERRDRVELDRKTRASERDTRQFSRRLAHAEEVDRVWLEAEAATKGNMVNAKGRGRGISDRYLMTAPERDVRKYGSEELLNYFADNPRPTAAHMRGKDTRLGAMYTPPRRKRGVRAAYQRSSLRKAAA